VIANDSDLAAILEQTMAQSRSIVEINIADDDGIIIASSTLLPEETSCGPAKISMPCAMRARSADRSDSDSEGRLRNARSSGHRRSAGGDRGQERCAVHDTDFGFTGAPSRRHASRTPDILVASGLALVAAFFLAWWSANLALRPLARISHIIDDIVSGRDLPPVDPDGQDAREWPSSRANSASWASVSRCAR